MKLIINILVFTVLLLITSCNTTSDKITQVQDYNIYLELVKNEALLNIEADRNFWEEKLGKEPNQFPYLSKIAASQSKLFNTTGNIDYLIHAEKNLILVNEKTNYGKAGYLRALARNYISQHKFKDALELIKKAEVNGENLKGTQKMMFDVHLELGNTKEAKAYLEKITNLSDFDYLIRLSKWSDHTGNLDAAIKYMEKATAMAESSKNKGLMQWSYTNLADFYGHNGQIKDAYNHYLKALKLQPNDAYAKKGIAWIVYSYERNPEEALRILNSITVQYNAPDYYLLKAEISEFMNKTDAKDNYLKDYFTSVKNEKYGAMYNKYNALLYAEEFKQADIAMQIAKTEIQERPTPQSYDLLAWAHYSKGEFETALKIMETHVVGKTFEPEAMYHLAQIYKANNKQKEVEPLKKELLESAFELGPLMEQQIKQI